MTAKMPGSPACLGCADGRTGSPRRAPLTLLQSVQEAAHLHPGKRAITGTIRVTYDELIRHVDAVAGQLMTVGVRTGEAVGVAAGRSPLAPLLALGVMRAGAVYLPLDPLYPDALLARMAAAAQVQTVLLDDSSGRRAPSADRVLPASAVLESPTDGHRLPAVAPCTAAYAMFTSGSSGAPKGIVLGHAGLAQYAQALPARVGLRAGDRCLGVAPLGFSSSIRQLLLPLAAGATVVVPTDEQVRTPWELADLVREQRVSHLDVTPSYWRALLDALPVDEARAMLAGVHRVLFASEPLDAHLAHRTRQLAPHARLWNLYGCTETTGIVTAYGLTGTEPMDAPVPIGTALDHVSVTAEPGPGGQIVVTGSAIALGSLDGGLPTTGGCAARRLATGDRAEMTAAGLVRLGRGDRMLKVRGMRVASESVEQHLLAHDGIRRAAVVAATERGLVCAVEPAPGAPAPDPRRLAAWLRERLPGHMVPAEITVTGDWPLLPNGKTDYQRLTALHQPATDLPGRGPDAH